ncbi:MAG: hypothetical protein J5626_04445 [Lachnospiraceae bacterium]|nr:hypothetical protein [Lachnospiraceae bacterium]
MDKALFLLQLFGWAFLSYFVSTLVHEWGHVIAGLMQGWKLIMITTGPFKLYRNDLSDRIRFGIEKNPLYWCGIGGTLPTKKEDAKIENYAGILLAGPLASIVLGLIAGVTLIWHRPIFLVFLAPVALGMGLVCLIPGLKTGILYNDGTRYMRIRKEGVTREEEKALFEASVLRAFDADSEYSEEGIEAMTASKDAEFRYLGHFYAYQNAKSRNDEAGMAKEQVQMESLKNNVPKSIIDMCAEM